MHWEQLLSLKRFGDKHKRLRSEQDALRPGFDVDYDRIIFSTPFRLLQDKTQVVPFSKTNFVHTRLTHSLEVSVVARSLGRMVGQAVLKKHPSLQAIQGYAANDFGSITAAAALAHDIGNPPFGHSGEKAIGHFFTHGSGKAYAAQLNAAQWHDLTHFEGNANGYRILNRFHQEKGGLRLSYATLGSFIKYPKASVPVKPSAHIAHKKYGYFQSEKAFFDDLVAELGLEKIGKSDTYARHPLVYLVEAADDICYTLIDFEDGINLGLIPEEFALEFLVKIVAENINTDKYSKMPYLEDRIAYLRAISINTLVNEAAQMFMQHETEILSGSFNTSLLEKSKFKVQIEDIIKISVQNIYRSKEVLEKELMGFRAINGLLETYTNAAVNKLQGKENTFDKLVLQTLPTQVLEVAHHDLYTQLMQICSHVALLTDSQAMDLNQKLNG
ncbi:MAG: dNTP triphosphohydrolase [Flavobacteriaceae bacterium]|nr:dNTP triphosphohydrolase [Flavobacteriaceae bacterium]